MNTNKCYLFSFIYHFLNHPFVLLATFTSVSITGTSVNTPTVVARAAGLVVPNKAIATATANSKKFDAPIIPASAGVPFVHSHKNNEEIYGVISGKGTAIIDGDTVEITAGDWLKISPVAKRQFFAASDSVITYVCIQVKENSLEGFTVDDAIIY